MASYFDQEEEFDERRKERRWNIPVPVRVKGTLADGTAFEEEAITADVSSTGMCVLIPRDVRVKDPLAIAAPEEQFEALATVVSVNPIGANLNRVRMVFTPPAKFTRAGAAKKYIYDFATDNWVGYTMNGAYYNSKHEEFGRVEGSTVVRLGSDQVLFQLKIDRAYDTRGNCVGHLI
jgi:PilZ domain-containing protein